MTLAEIFRAWRCEDALRAAARAVPPSNDAIKRFYNSWSWKRLRWKVLQEREARCEYCGAGPNDLDENGVKVRLVLDHRKPVRHFWHLRLEPKNLVVACDGCNRGKGSTFDEADEADEAEKVPAP